MEAIYSYFYPNYKEWTVINNHIHPLSMIINKNTYDFYVNEQYKITFDMNEKVTLICKTCLFKKKKHLHYVDLADDYNDTPSFVTIDMTTGDT